MNVLQSHPTIKRRTSTKIIIRKLLKEMIQKLLPGIYPIGPDIKCNIVLNRTFINEHCQLFVTRSTLQISIFNISYVLNFYSKATKKEIISKKQINRAICDHIFARKMIKEDISFIEIFI